MPGTSPIQLGSAVSGWTFEAASSVGESASGIQTCTVSALWPIGSTVLSNLPTAGSSVSGITSYIPSDFLLDYSESGPAVDFIEGTVARVKFKFKRPDPNRSGATASRKVHMDSIINYKSIVTPLFNYQLAADGQPQDGIFGFPEPVCTVTYNTSIAPGIGSGGLASIYALPGSAAAQGFPDVTPIAVPISYTLAPGSSITYFNGSAYVSGTVLVQTTINFNVNFTGNFRGWQLTKLQSDPIANRSFFDVTEIWRNFYVFTGITFVGAVPPIPP